MLDLPVFLLALGAVARITRFLSEDDLARPLRALARPRRMGVAEFDVCPRTEGGHRWGLDDPKAVHVCGTCFTIRQSKLLKLITCPWCLSIWVAAAVVPLAYLSAGSWLFTVPASVLSISYVYAVSSQLLDRPHVHAEV